MAAAAVAAAAPPSRPSTLSATPWPRTDAGASVDGPSLGVAGPLHGSGGGAAAAGGRGEGIPVGVEVGR